MSRIDRVTTKAGDSGNTQLAEGTVLSKDHPRVEALGSVDELNSALGMVLAYEAVSGDVRKALEPVQHDLFDFGAELAVPGSVTLESPAITHVEEAITALNRKLPPLKEFVLPGGSPATAACHLARTICRRAERRLITLGREETLRPELIVYINRLSDLLFIAARCIQADQGLPELQWDRNRRA